MQGLGLSFEESVVTMSQFEQSGIDGSKALSYLTKAQAKASREYKSVTQVLSEFNDVAKSSTDENEKLNYAAELFGDRGGGDSAHQPAGTHEAPN